ncbi:Tn3 family transposase [Nonomuraea sp. PA05]|nr:Tn3 family transposase [Nonomuraea sp. PA05]
MALLPSRLSMISKSTLRDTVATLSGSTDHGILHPSKTCSAPVNDRGMGRGAKIVSGTSLHMVDVIFGLDGGDLPEIVVSDTGSYSDLTFGLLELLGISYRPALADLPDQGLADQLRGRLRPAQHPGPGKDRFAESAPELGGHPASGRLDLHRHRPRLRRGHHASASGGVPPTAR